MYIKYTTHWWLSLCVCVFAWLSDRAAEAGAEQEGVWDAGAADQTGNTDQSELGLQAAHRSAKRVAQCQGAARQHTPDRGQCVHIHTWRKHNPETYKHTPVKPQTCKHWHCTKPLSSFLENNFKDPSRDGHSVDPCSNKDTIHHSDHSASIGADNSSFAWSVLG